MKKKSVGNFQNFGFGFLFVFVVGFCLFPGIKVDAAIANHMLINEIHMDGLVGTGGHYDDWIELYNPSGSVVDLTAWSIQKQSSTLGSTVTRNVLSGEVPAGGYLLLVRNDDDTNDALKNMADILLSSSFSLADGNVVYLVNDNEDIVDMADANIVDFVGMGSSESYEGTGTAPNPPETKSVSRLPDGDDDDDNASDFVILDSPSPENSESGEEGDDGIGGTVLLTITDEGQENVAVNSVDIVFQINDNAKALINYGADGSYGNSSVLHDITVNTFSSITITNLACNTEYHYSIYAENLDFSETDNTIDAVFTTLPCGIQVDSLVMTKTSARANNSFFDAWQWEFDLTIWDLSETSLKMKFDQWSGAGSLDSASNMQFSVDDGLNWFDITENGVYSPFGADVSGIDEAVDAGRQVSVVVQMKLPVGTVAGEYVSSYGILTE